MSTSAIAERTAADVIAGPLTRDERPSLWSFVRPDRWRIALTYLLFNVENLLRVAEPMVLGWAVNDLLRSGHRGLVAFLALRVVSIIIGAVRRAYDTRLFTGISVRLVTSVVTRQLGQDVEHSRVLARSRLSQEIVDFFEHYLPIVLHTGYTVVGAVVMLTWFDPLLVAFSLAVLLPVWLLSLRHGRRTNRLNTGYNDELERQADVIGSGDAALIRGHYDRLARWQVRVSDAVAVNFVAMGVLSLLLTAGTLLYGCRLPDVQSGDLLAVFSYLGMFVLGLEQIPVLVQQSGRLRDIARRLRNE